MSGRLDRVQDELRARMAAILAEKAVDEFRERLRPLDPAAQSAAWRRVLAYAAERSPQILRHGAHPEVQT